MKKMGLFCAVLLACGSLAGCGLQNHQGDKEAASISKLKAENSSLKANKNRSHKHNKNRNKSSSDVSSSTKSTTKTTQGKSSTRDPKEEEAAKAMRDYDPEWWDSLSPEEQQYWAHHTAYGSNEDFMYAPGLYEKHLIQQQPSAPSSDSSNTGGQNVGEATTPAPSDTQ